MNHAPLPLALMLSFAFFATPASAQLIDMNGSSLFEIETLTSTDTSTGTEAAAPEDAGIRIDAEAELTGDTAALETDSAAEAAVGFDLTRRGLDRNTEYVVTDADRVRSYAGLESYAATSIRDDSRLEAVAVSEERMEIRYEKPARFLGFIPAHMLVRVSVGSDGTVAASYPWYAFLMATGESPAELEARLATEIRAFGELTAMTATSTVTGEPVPVVSDEARPNRAESLRWARVLERLRASLAVDVRSGAEA